MNCEAIYTNTNSTPFCYNGHIGTLEPRPKSLQANVSFRDNREAKGTDRLGPCSARRGYTRDSD